MAESLEEAVPCGFSLLLPARPLARLSEYAAAPQRHAAFHGEVVPLVFVVRYAGRRGGARRAAAAAAATEGRESSDPAGAPLGRVAGGSDEVTVDDGDDEEEEEDEGEDAALRAVWSRISPELRASAGVTAAQADRRDGTDGGGGGAAEEDGHEEEGGEGEGGEEGGEGGEERPTRRPLAPGFRHCRPLLMHGDVRPEQLHEEEREVLPAEVIFSLRVRLDKLPIETSRAKITVAVWSCDRDSPELRSQSFLRLLQCREPAQLFRADRPGVRTQVSSWINVLPPPSLSCRQLNVAGQHLTAIRVQHRVQAAPVCVQNLRVLPNLNTGYLPLMPDGSMMLADNTYHVSGEVGMASLLRQDCPSCRLPLTLEPLEAASFLFTLHLAPTGTAHGARREGVEVPLLVTLHWTSPAFPISHSVYTHYRLPSVQLERPRLVMMAECESPVRACESFLVTFTLLNQLQDFLSVRLVWAPERERAHRATRARPGDGGGSGEAGGGEAGVPPVVCHSPTTHLGFCGRGSTLTFQVGFQVLRAGLFELSQQMKLKLQFTASAHAGGAAAVPAGGSAGAPPPGLVLARNHSPGSPAVRDLQQAAIGRSQSFSHQQQPRNGHFVRSGSVMERRAITPPVPSPRPLPPAPERAALSLDKVAKRSCKVLVLEPGAS